MNNIKFSQSCIAFGLPCVVSHLYGKVKVSDLSKERPTKKFSVDFDESLMRVEK